MPPGAGPHPLLCFLHGYDEAAPVPPRHGLTRWGPLRPGNPAAIAQRFAILAPQLPRAGDHWHRYGAELQGLIERLEGVDRRRCYLTGFSFGANGVFDLASLQPGRWAALWAVDPTRLPQRDPQLPVWLSFGEVARSRKAAFIQVLALERDASGERVYADAGDDHVGAARRAYADERIYSWLLNHAQREPG